MIGKSFVIYTKIDNLLKEMEHKGPKNRNISNSEVLTTAIISAQYF